MTMLLTALQCQICYVDVLLQYKVAAQQVRRCDLWLTYLHSLECTLGAYMWHAVGLVIGRRAPITFSFVCVTTPLQQNSQQTESLKWRSDGVTFHYLFYSYYSQMFRSLSFRPWSEGNRSWGTEYSLPVLSDRRPNSDFYATSKDFPVNLAVFCQFSEGNNR